MRDHIGIREGFDSDLCCHSDLVVVHIHEVLRAVVGGCCVCHISRHFRYDSISRNAILDTSSLKSANGLLLCRHKSVVCRHFRLLSLWNELDIRLLCAANVSNGVLCQFDASFSILLDDIASDVWVALATLDYDAIVATSVDCIFPHLRCAELGTICSSDLYAVFVTSFNPILDQMRLVVVNFYSDFIQIKRVANDQGLDIKIGVDSCASAEVYPVGLYSRTALLSLDVDTVSVA